MPAPACCTRWLRQTRRLGACRSRGVQGSALPGTRVRSSTPLDCMGRARVGQHRICIKMAAPGQALLFAPLGWGITCTCHLCAALLEVATHQRAQRCRWAPPCGLAPQLAQQSERKSPCCCTSLLFANLQQQKRAAGSPRWTCTGARQEPPDQLAGVEWHQQHSGFASISTSAPARLHERQVIQPQAVPHGAAKQGGRVSRHDQKQVQAGAAWD